MDAILRLGSDIAMPILLAPRSNPRTRPLWGRVLEKREIVSVIMDVILQCPSMYDKTQRPSSCMCSG